jgi:hypothetical protein
MKYIIHDNFESKQIIGISLPDQLSDSWFIVLILVTSIALSYFLFYLIKFWVIANDFSKREVFSIENAKSLNAIGKGTCFFTVTLIIIDFIINFSDLLTRMNEVGTKSLAYNLGARVGLISILIISELIAKGSLIKSENDLTI